MPKKRVAMGLAISIVAVPTILWLIYYLPELLVRDANIAHMTATEQLRAISEERRTVVAALAAIGAGAGLVISYFRHKLERERHDLDRDRHALDQDSNRTDRYAKAVELLAHEDISVRLGGIYALGRIAVDSPRDRITVYDVLFAFVRARAPRRDPDSSEDRYPPPDTDVLAAFTVIGRRPVGDDTYPPADLTGVTLRGREVNLAGANLKGANLRQADISYINLSGADLRGADLTDANLPHAKLDGADLRGAILIDPGFQRSSARNVDFRDATIDQMWFTGSDLTGSDFRGARVFDCRFDGANLDGVDFTGADLTDTSMAGANLTGDTKITGEQMATLRNQPEDGPLLEIPR